jgi:hypothetical protein
MEEVDLIIEADSEEDKENVKMAIIEQGSLQGNKKVDNEVVGHEGQDDSEEGDDLEDDSEDEEDLDTSWIENEEFRNSYEKEPMKDLVVFFVYIDKYLSIEKIIKENIEIDDCSLSKEKLLHLIQTKRHRPDGSIGKKYKLIDLMEFHVPLEPDELEGFVREDYVGRFFKPLPIFQTINVDPSIFIFHDLNSLFFFFKEIENPVKSILKTGENGVSGRVTKKVRLDTGEYLEKKRKSMKRMMRSVRKTRKV